SGSSRAGAHAAAGPPPDAPAGTARAGRAGRPCRGARTNHPWRWISSHATRRMRPNGMHPTLRTAASAVFVQRATGHAVIALDEGGIFGRGGGIRTRDPLLPKQMRYQAALRPEGARL